MGYLTNFQLSIYHNSVYYYDKKEMILERKEILGSILPDLIVEKIIKYYKKERIDGESFQRILKEFEIILKECDFFDEEGYTDCCKWYDAQQDVIDFSKKYPKLLFKLRGEGSEFEDRWLLYAINGKYYAGSAKIIITYPKFDSSYLLTKEELTAKKAPIKAKNLPQWI
jgi:hypothetical protein